MNSPLKICAAFAVALCAAALVQVHAQSSATNPPPLTPPLPSFRQIKPGVTLHELSPVVYFRSILGMSPAERTKALASKPADYQKAVLGKVEEYQALPPDIREVRLHETQLRWDLITLMSLPPDARPPFLKDLAAPDRATLTDRLAQWDRLSPEMQKAFLEKESFLDFYLRWAAGTPSEQQASLGNLPPARREELTNALARWQSVPAADRQRLCDQFHQFFAQNPEQQTKTLTVFTDSERQAMQAALIHFAGMTPVQRQSCVESFQKFATMSPDERNQFLKNADHWEAMTPDERTVWTALVQKYPILPPMPPDPRNPLMPPSPPGMPPWPGMVIPPPPLPSTNLDLTTKLAGARN